MASTPSLKRRVPLFDGIEEIDTIWTPLTPEFSMVANSVSLLMPVIEPFVARSVRDIVPELDEPLRREAETYVQQETAHFTVHRRFNKAVVPKYRGVGMLLRIVSAVVNAMSKRSTVFRVGFATGAEHVAYCVARWVELRQGSLFFSADNVASHVFIWHLAEEVEHRDIANEAYYTIGGTRLKLIVPMLISTLILGLFTWMSTTLMAIHHRRFFNPLSLGRLVVWAFSFVFDLIGDLVLAVIHGPNQPLAVDPAFYHELLRGWDEDELDFAGWRASTP